MLERILNKIYFKKTIVGTLLLFGLSGCSGDTIINNYYTNGNDAKQEISEGDDSTDTKQDTVPDTYMPDVKEEANFDFHSEELNNDYIASPDNFIGTDTSQKDLIDIMNTFDTTDVTLSDEEIKDYDLEIKQDTDLDDITNPIGCHDLKDYPTCFVKDGMFNGYLVVGENAPAIDNLSMTDIALSMIYLKCTYGDITECIFTPVTLVDATKLDSEIADYKAQNLIVIGNPCNNYISAELLGNPANCFEGFTPGQARIKLFLQQTGYTSMLVAGYNGKDTKLAAEVIAHRWKELSGMEVIIEGTTWQDATISPPSPL